MSSPGCRTETGSRSRSRSYWKRAWQSAFFWGAVGALVRVGANIILLPLILHRLTLAEQAAWWVFVALGGMVQLVDFGFAQALGRVYSYLWAGADDFETEGLGPPPKQREPNLPRLRVLNATVRHLYLRLSLFGAGLLAIVGTLFVSSHVRTSAQPGMMWACWMLYVVAVSYGLVTTHWYIACQGVNRVRELQASNLWSGLAYVISAAILLVLGWGLFAMVVATFLRGWLARQVCRRAFQQAVPPDGSGGRDQPEKDMLRKLWPNARKFGVLSIGVYLTFQANVLVCDWFLDKQTTASFGLTSQITMFLMSFSGLWLSVKWPELTILRTQRRLREMGMLFARRLAMVMITFLMGAVMLIFLGNLLLEWKGANTRLLPTSMLVVYLLYWGQQLFYAQFGSLKFTENVVPFFKLSLFTGLGLVALSSVLTWKIGVWGLILGPLIASLACCTWYVPRQGFLAQPLNLRQFVRAAIRGRL